MKLTGQFLPLLLSIFVSGCATLAPLTEEERTSIRRINVESRLGSELEYFKLGTTAFQNKISNMPDEGIFLDLEESIRDELVSRGYELVPVLSEADIGFVLAPGTTYNYPSGYGVDGAGFFVHIMLGMNSGIQAQARIVARLVDPDTSKQRYAKVIDRTKITKIKENANQWVDLSPTQRAQLIEELKVLLSDVAEEAIEGSGL